MRVIDSIIASDKWQWGDNPIRWVLFQTAPISINTSTYLPP
jgi:hypothetical protein